MKEEILLKTLEKLKEELKKLKENKRNVNFLSEDNLNFILNDSIEDLKKSIEKTIFDLNFIKYKETAYHNKIDISKEVEQKNNLAIIDKLGISVFQYHNRFLD